MTRSPQHWIALVIGNSRLHWAWSNQDTPHQFWHTPYLPDDAIATLVRHHFDFNVLQHFWPELPPEVAAIAPCYRADAAPALFVASVVPEQTATWQTHCPTATILTLDRVPLTHTYSTLGIDRALAAYSGVCQYHRATLVIDAGTAFTFTGVDENFRFIGGAILPGVRLQFQSLNRGTADLPMVSLNQPDAFALPDRWAMQTEAAILSGILYSLTSSIQGFVEDWRDRYPDSVVVLTGGDRSIIAAVLEQTAPELLKQLHVSDTVVMEGLIAVIEKEYQ